MLTLARLVPALVLMSLPVEAAASGPLDLPRRGGVAPRVEIITIGDFQCPLTKRSLATLEAIGRRYRDDVRFAFMHDPMPFHEEAREAAHAAVAAQQQGAFWAMHDRLFADQRRLWDDDLEASARALGLDLRRFERDEDSDMAAFLVDRDERIAAALGAIHTPTFFINGVPVHGVHPLGTFSRLIDREIAAALEAGERGDAWIDRRTRSNNPQLHDHVFKGLEPPELSDDWPEPVDPTVHYVPVDPLRDAVLGSDKALVTLVVFGSLQCRYTLQLMPTLDALLAAYPDDLRVVFRHKPLAHQKQARGAAEVALCAREQGGFWRMARRLLEHMRQLPALLGPDGQVPTAALDAHARAVGLDPARLGDCLVSDRQRAQIDRDLEAAFTAGVQGTPSSFVNGRKLFGVQSAEALRSLIDEERVKARARAVAGTLLGQPLYAQLIATGERFEMLDAKVHTFRDGARLGPAGAPVEMVLFGCLLCPHTRLLLPRLRAVRRSYGDRASLTFKHLPHRGYRHWQSVARAAVCARAQGRFWPFLDVVVAEHHRAMKPSDLRRYATRVGLDLSAFDACLADPATTQRITADESEARAALVRGTPTIFFNGHRVRTHEDWDIESFWSAVERRVLRRSP